MAGTLIGSHIPIGHIGSEDLEYDLEGRGGDNFFLWQSSIILTTLEQFDLDRRWWRRIFVGVSHAHT